jgi:nicotinate-nucleotide pyrophosphorylase (carboxylating)
MFVPRKILEEKLKQMLAEDVGLGDVTVAAVVPSGLTVEAAVKAKEAGIAAGVEESVILAESLGLNVTVEVADGEEFRKGQVIMKVSGDARTVLSVERTILNFISRMSGIATTTKRLTEKLKKVNAKVKIAATRKTAPGLLYFDKKAVLIGGGDPHRLHLGDMVLVKDNHIAVAGSIENAVKNAKQSVSFSKKIEVEVTRVTDVLKAAEAGADIIMLDNFSPKQIKEAVGLLRKAGFFGKILLEASGKITAENLLEYAATNVDVISLGELTHSVQAVDVNLEITRIGEKGKNAYR